MTALFSITCTTCKSRLKVREEAAIGHIPACPKCGGMVMVKPPDGWQKGQPLAPPTAEAPPGITTVVNLRRPEETRGDSHFEDIDELLSDAPPRLKPSGVSVAPDAPGLARPRFAGTPPAAAHPVAPTATHPTPPATTASSNGSPGEAAGGSKRPSAVEAPPAAAAAAALPAAPSLPSPGNPSAQAVQPPPPAEADPPSIAAASASAAGPLRYWLMMAGSVAAGIGLALAVVVGMIWLFRADPQAVAQAQTNGKTQAISPVPAPVTPVASISPEDPSEVEPEPTPTPTITPAPAVADSKDPANPVEPAAPIDPMPSAEDDDPLGLTKSTPETPAVPARSKDPLAKFDELIGGDNEDPLTTPVEPAEASPAEPPEADPAEATPARPILPRPTPLSVDIAARLTDPLAGIETTGTPLADFLQVISDLSTIPITLETDALPYYGLTPESPVVLKASNTTVGGALSSALAPLRLEHVEADGHLIVRAVEPAELPSLGFPVKDLTDGDEAQMTELAEAMKTLVHPDAWNEAEGGGSIGVNLAKGTLDIRQRRAIQADLLIAFEKLRTGRKLPYATGAKYDPGLFALSTRSAKATARLETPVSLTFAQPAHFVRILDHLAKAGGVRILVDWRDIASAGWDADGEATLVADKQPLGAALDALLGPMDLSWRIVDGRTIQIVTPQRLADRLELEFYKVDTLTSDDATGAKLVAKVRLALGESLFRDASGSDSGGRDSGGQCDLRYDEPSQCLLASLPQPKQRELEALLETWISTDR